MEDKQMIPKDWTEEEIIFANRVLHHRMVEQGGHGRCYVHPDRSIVHGGEHAEGDCHAVEATRRVIQEVREIDEVLRGEGPSKPPVPERPSFLRELESLINRHSLEGGSNTPDFVLASYLKSCLATWDLHTQERDRWYGNRSILGPGNEMPAVDTSEISVLSIYPSPPKDTVWQAPPLKPLDIPMGLKGAINQVYLFHEKFGVPWYTDTPMWPGLERAKLRWRLMRDEFTELQVAWGCLEDLLLDAGLNEQITTPGDHAGSPDFVREFRKRLAAVAREMVDEIYTIIGTAGEMGIDLAEVWDVVHRTNMAKVGGGTDDQGKVLKPEGWQEPDVESAIFT
jgi:predicted HAD superfamily Cof-like phosphohydrolase